MKPEIELFDSGDIVLLHEGIVRVTAGRLRMCRFLDAGGTETLHTRGEPASKKRQGTKSREAGRRLGGERYGDFRLAAHSMEAGHWGDATCMPARGGGRESEGSVPGGV